MVNVAILASVTAVFMAVTIYLGWYGYRSTKDNGQFLLGKNKANPVLIALSYGATFISTSAIVGFGGMAARYGLSIVWLAVLCILVGTILAFLVFGKRTRRIGNSLGAFTFADFLGKRFKSGWIRTVVALIILIGMPIYCAAVLIGGVNLIAVTIGLDKNVALLGLSLIVAMYVTFGGVIAVMYNDALQAGIMFIGMVVILIVTFSTLGGVTNAFESLSALDPGMAGGVLDGFTGWTSVADFGSSEWMLVVTTFLMGVGLGVLTQPQLIVRFMSAKDDRMLDRSLIVGSIFMLVIVGTAYTAGALSNVFFMNKDGGLAFNYVSGLGLGTDFIIPQYILEVFDGVLGGDFFVCLFLLSLVCASISTISALMHTIGAAGGYDLYTLAKNRREKKEADSQNVRVNRICTAVMMVLVVIYCYVMPKDIIAKATSLFMGMTAAALLPAFVHGLYTKGRPNKRAAVCSIAVGTSSYLFWALFINKSSSVFLPICKMLTGDAVLFSGPIQYCDALIVSLPLSIAAFLIVMAIDRYCGSRKLQPAEAE